MVLICISLVISDVAFSAETLEVRKEQGDRSTVLKEKTCHPKMLYLENLSFKNEEEIKTLSITRPALQETLKGV